MTLTLEGFRADFCFGSFSKLITVMNIILSLKHDLPISLHAGHQLLLGVLMMGVMELSVVMEEERCLMRQSRYKGAGCDDDEVEELGNTE